MGKNIVQQARGKGSTTYRAPSFKYKGASRHLPLSETPLAGKIVDLLHCRGHSAPLMKIEYIYNGQRDSTLMVAPENVKIGDMVAYGTAPGQAQDVRSGNCAKLKDLPEGTLICNIELQPGDGGRLVRAGGAFGRIIANIKDKIMVMLPSKKQRGFDPECRACVGIVAGGGRTEKPFMKAGRKYHKMRARNKLWPKTSGCAMNAVDHPYGKGCSSRKGRPTIAPRFAPPGRKVGMLRPSKTGRAKSSAAL